VDLSSLVGEFRTETREHLRRLGTELLRLEQDPNNPEPARRMFLAAHSVKGDSAMLGYMTSREVASSMEELLAQLRDGKRVLDSEGADLLLHGCDLVRSLVDSEAQPPESLAAQAASYSQLITQWIGAERDAPVFAEPGVFRGDTKEDQETGSIVEAGTEAAPRAPVELSGQGSPRALVVENSRTMRLMESGLLGTLGFEVDTAEDGDEALQRWRSGFYDLVITGMEIQGLRGLDLVAAIRASPNGQRATVVVMSSNQRPEDRMRAAGLGVTQFILRGGGGNQQLARVAERVLADRGGTLPRILG
jgi:chemotaxis protein histidine kinase CheA